MRYYLFRYALGHFRLERAANVREACRLAFGVVYDRANDEVVFKDVGTRSPKYIAQKVKAEWYKDDGWRRIHGTIRCRCERDDTVFLASPKRLAKTDYDKDGDMCVDCPTCGRGYAHYNGGKLLAELGEEHIKGWYSDRQLTLLEV